MSPNEADRIDRLADLQRDYHEEVVRFIAAQEERCTHCQEDLAGVRAEVFGREPRNELALGLKDRVAKTETVCTSLVTTRATWRRIFWYCAGALATALAALVTKPLASLMK